MSIPTFFIFELGCHGTAVVLSVTRFGGAYTPDSHSGIKTGFMCTPNTAVYANVSAVQTLQYSFSMAKRNYDSVCLKKQSLRLQPVHQRMCSTASDQRSHRLSQR